MRKYDNEKLKNGVIIFSSNTCGACRMVKPSLEKLEKEMGIDVIDVNIMINSDYAKEEEVTSLPTLLFIKDGETVERVVGFMPEPELRKRIEKIVGEE